MILSLYMSLPFKLIALTSLADDWVMMFLDISRAHPHCPTRRDVWTEFPPEHPLASDRSKCGKLAMTLYGCRDAGQNFELFVYDIMMEVNAVRGKTNPCVYSGSTTTD